METVFKHKPTFEILDVIGIPQRTEREYLQALTLQTGKERLELRTLSDLQELFVYTGDKQQLSRIEKLLEKNGAYNVVVNE